MLRTLGSIACVLLLTGLVAGGLYLLVGAGGHSEREQPPPGAGVVYGRGGHGRGGRWDGGAPNQRDRRGHDQASLGRGIGGMFVTALQTGAVAAAVVGIQTHSRRRRKNGRTVPGAQATGQNLR